LVRPGDVFKQHAAVSVVADVAPGGAELVEQGFEAAIRGE